MHFGFGPFRGVGGFVLAVLCFAPPLWAAAPQSMVVRGQSMAPLLFEGQSVQVLPISEREIRRGDLVVFRAAGNPRAPVIKQVAGLMGDRLELGKDKTVRVNGRVYYGPDGAPYRLSTKGVAMLSLYLGEIPKDRFLVLGRSGTLDSSRFGLISTEDIQCVVVVR